MPKRVLQGKVVSNKMKDTLVVEVERVVAHPKYKRRYKVHKKYKAHVKEGGYDVGDTVLIKECKPVSKDKHFRVVGKASKPVAVIAEEVKEDMEQKEENKEERSEEKIEEEIKE